jgi:hypothetical protein
MSNVLNQQTPAFPTVPVADQFGTVHFFPGMSKQEYLACQLFVKMYERITDDFEKGIYEDRTELMLDVKAAKVTCLEVAEFFYQTETENKPTSLFVSP